MGQRPRAALQSSGSRPRASRGAPALRLFTPAGHARGRRFYEREGWTLKGEPFEEERFGMPLVEYRFALR